MNERIKELIEQCTEVYPIKPRGPWFDKEKFAELIVQECISVVDQTLPPGYADYPDYRDQIENAFRRECAIEIKKHFGVKE